MSLFQLHIKFKSLIEIRASLHVPCLMVFNCSLCTPYFFVFTFVSNGFRLISEPKITAGLREVPDVVEANCMAAWQVINSWIIEIEHEAEFHFPKSKHRAVFLRAHNTRDYGWSSGHWPRYQINDCFRNGPFFGIHFLSLVLRLPS